jgi:hypothetical protein
VGSYRLEMDLTRTKIARAARDRRRHGVCVAHGFLPALALNLLFPRARVAVLESEMISVRSSVRIGPGPPACSLALGPK